MSDSETKQRFRKQAIRYTVIAVILGVTAWFGWSFANKKEKTGSRYQSLMIPLFTSGSLLTVKLLDDVAAAVHITNVGDGAMKSLCDCENVYK